MLSIYHSNGSLLGSLGSIFVRKALFMAAIAKSNHSTQHVHIFPNLACTIVFALVYMSSIVDGAVSAAAAISKPSLNIAVGSTNPVKLNASVSGVSKAFLGNFDVKGRGFNVPSGGEHVCPRLHKFIIALLLLFFPLTVFVSKSTQFLISL